MKFILALMIISNVIGFACSCRVESEKLKLYARNLIERLLDPDILESVYWNDEPLDFGALSKATGMNVTMAKTRFELKPISNSKSKKSSLIKDMFVTCSTERNRKYILTLNLELDNPFKVVDMEVALTNQANDKGIDYGNLRIKLAKSTFLVQLNQKISYDQCLEVNYVQLSPSMRYDIECAGCSDSLNKYLDRMLNRRMTQLDAEMDAMLSEKLLLGLQNLLSQQRLDLDLYIR